MLPYVCTTVQCAQSIYCVHWQHCYSYDMYCADKLFVSCVVFSVFPLACNIISNRIDTYIYEYDVHCSISSDWQRFYNAIRVRRTVEMMMYNMVYNITAVCPPKQFFFFFMIQCLNFQSRVPQTEFKNT